MKKVTAISDNDGHWYVIPEELEDEFHKLLEDPESIYDGSWDKFEGYRTGGDLNNVQLYAEID